MNQRWVRNSFVYLLILGAVVAIFYVVFRSPSSGQDVDITEIITRAQARDLVQIQVDGNSIEAETREGARLRSLKEENVSILELLNDAGVDTGSIPVEVKQSSSFGRVFGTLLGFLPLLLFGGLILFMMRQAQGSNNQAMSFGRSKARLFVGNRPAVTFSDVAGVEEAKTELQEVVEFLMYPERFASLGARIPKGVLLVGPPGTGKTLLARAVAGEAGVPFFNISGSEFVEMFVGVGASRVRDLFNQARRNAPCIIFVDEIDAVGRHRGAGLGGGHDEREQTLNQILVEMDGFDATTNIIILAATNRPDILDPALLRPGRFDRRVILDAPDIAGRKAILGVHAKGKPLESGLDLEVVAKQSAGMSGADLANLVNEAALLAARRAKKLIGPDEFEEAIDRVIAGPERKSRVVTQQDKEVTAYHEAGHALVAHKTEHADPVHKITIIPRGIAGGYTRFLPPERRMASRDQLKAWMRVAMGGRVAEEDHLRRHHQRRLGRPSTRHGHRPQDGHRVGHERGPRTAHLRAASGDGLPWARDLGTAGLRRQDRGPDRRRDQRADGGSPHRGARSAHHAPAQAGADGAAPPLRGDDRRRGAGAPIRGRGPAP